VATKVYPPKVATKVYPPKVRLPKALAILPQSKGLTLRL
jgi:hypothetical protein